MVEIPRCFVIGAKFYCKSVGKKYSFGNDVCLLKDCIFITGKVFADRRLRGQLQVLPCNFTTSEVLPKNPAAAGVEMSKTFLTAAILPTFLVFCLYHTLSVQGKTDISPKIFKKLAFQDLSFYVFIHFSILQY